MVHTLNRWVIFIAAFASVFVISALCSAQEVDKAQRLQEILRRLEGEPSVDEVQKAALLFYSVDEETISSYSSRADWKAILPKIGGEVRTNQIDTDVDKFNFVEYGERQAGEDLVGGKVFEVKVGATWDLPKLVYNSEVLDVYSVRSLRQSLLKEVTRLFYLRRRLKIEFLLQPPSDPATRIAKELRIDEVTATIDAMTDGVYRKHRKARGR